MKKKLLLLLLITGSAGMLFAQANMNNFYGSVYAGGNPGKSDYLFGYPPPGKTKVNFYVYDLKNSGSLMLELNNIRQFTRLPDLDSILSVVKANLKVLADSLKEDGINRRVDYVATSRDPQIRIINHATPKQFVITKGELNELKTEQDTLRIKAFAFTDDTATFKIKQKMKPWLVNNQPFFITLVVNNISDIYALDPGVLQNAIAKLKERITDDYASTADPAASYRAYVYLRQNITYPSRAKWSKNISSGHYTEFVPNVYAGLSFARGNFIPSISAGLRYTADDGLYATRHFFAMWEPHFIFSHDAANKVLTDRNDFVTLRYTIIFKQSKTPFDFVSNVSLGYLVHRSGNWFEPGTFKVGIPGVRSGWLQLEPEFFFNGFLKNFSPSLRLTIHYE